MLTSADTLQEVCGRLNEDEQFLLRARKWEGRFKVIVGGDVLLVVIHDGRVERIERHPSLFTESDFIISGTEDDWDQLLAKYPKPFYQDIYSAWLHHGVSVEGDLEQFFAFHMALRRLLMLVRSLG